MLPLAIVLSYLLGSVPFAVLVSRVMGLPDPRGFGSGNPGATNVLRSGSRLAAALTLIGDSGKGALAVGLAALAGLDLEAQSLCGAAAFAGHVFSAFLRLRGGKGVATAAGVLLALDPRLGGLTLLAWLAAFGATRISSVGAIVAASAAPAFAFWLHPDGLLAWAVLAMSALLLIRHRSNIAKLLDGSEGRVGRR